MKLSSLEAIVSALQSAEVRYLIAGGLGYRPTAPVPAAQFADPRSRESWIRDKNMVVFALHSDRHPETLIDLFVAEPFDFNTEYDRAMIGHILPDLPTRFVSLDTLLRMKESTGRPKDLEDIRQLRLLSGDQQG
jgi:hypothetical protein